MVLDEVSTVEPESEDVRAQASQAPEAFGRFDGLVIEERGGMHETCPIVRPGNQQVEDDEGA